MRIPLVHVASVPDDQALSLELLGHEVLVFRNRLGEVEALINPCAVRGLDRKRHGRWLGDTWPDHGAPVEADDDGQPCERPHLLPLSTHVENGVLTYVQGD